MAVECADIAGERTPFVDLKSFHVPHPFCVWELGSERRLELLSPLCRLWTKDYHR